MIKARNRKLSMLLVLAMLMTMFVGVGSASAADMFKTLSAPIVDDDNTVQALGKVSVDIPDVRSLDEAGEWLTISLPSGFEYDGGPGAEYDDTGLVVETDDNIGIAGVIQTADDVVEVAVYSMYGYFDDEKEGSILLSFNEILVKSSAEEGDVIAKFLSNGATFGQLNTAVIAKIGSGATTVMAKSVKTIGDAGGEIDTLIIAETKAGVFEEDEIIELRLPKGFTWKDQGTVMGAWGLLTGVPYGWEIDPDNDRIINIDMGDQVSSTSAGRVNIGTSLGEFFAIDVEDSANFGDVYVTVSSDKDAVEEQKVLVATYGDYGVEIVEDTQEEVLVGRANQELGEFYIKEKLPESLDAGRSLYFELPSGVKWAVDEEGDPIIKLEVESGSGITTPTYKLSNKDRKLQVDFLFDLGEDGERFSTSKAKILVKDMEVNIEPSFEGEEIAITVSGKAGAEGEAVVATVVKPVTFKAENPTKVEIGAMNQAAGDLLIIENVDGAILDEDAEFVYEDEYYEFDPILYITLPKGVTFAEDPVVEVEGEGDLDLGDIDYYDDALIINIDTASTEPSTIRISEIFLTVDRTVPEGNVLATLAGMELSNDWVEFEGSTALVNWATEESYGDAAIATTITPSTGGYAEFVIGSNIYSIGGVPYVMDVVPYIKDSRSFVPMRYLAEMLGAEIEWFPTDQTVTFEGYTADGKITVVLTIGSNTYTVNGEAKTMDVAPEIVNDRSFLPARFVAEAFGAQVGWTEATQTVTIVR